MINEKFLVHSEVHTVQPWNELTHYGSAHYNEEHLSLANEVSVLSSNSSESR
jgi:hypothetical protein